MSFPEIIQPKYFQDYYNMPNNLRLICRKGGSWARNINISLPSTYAVSQITELQNKLVSYCVYLSWFKYTNMAD